MHHSGFVHWRGSRTTAAPRTGSGTNIGFTRAWFKKLLHIEVQKQIC